MALIKKYIPQLLRDKIKNSLLYAHIRVNILKKPIRIWFFRESGFSNFGDELTTDIIERLFNKRCELVSIDDADLYAVGSIIEVFDHQRYKKSYVWGSGFMRAGESIHNENLIFRAVRGCDSRARLQAKYKDIPIGDPGLLSNLIYESSAISSEGKIGILPHYVDEDNPLIVEAKNDSRFMIISVKNSPDSVVRDITSCKLVLSSSLHGLIVSDSCGVPNIHMPLSSKVVGENYKFKDYYSSINKKYETFNKDHIFINEKLNEAIKTYKPISGLGAIQKALIDSFPFK